MPSESENVARFRAKAAAVQARIDAACRRSGRNPSEVRVLWVGKNHPASLLREAHAAGARLFGENRVQEVLEKFPLRAKDGSILDHALHFIGHLQSNKIRKILPLCSAIHSVHSAELWRALDRVAGELGVRRDVFLQVNTSGEAQKSGFAVEGFADALAALPPAPNLRLVGLMTMGPVESVHVSETSRQCFKTLRHLLETTGRISKNESKIPEFRNLSMGMSSDFEIAVEEGAHFLRIGTYLFSP